MGCIINQGSADPVTPGTRTLSLSALSVHLKVSPKVKITTNHIQDKGSNTITSDHSLFKL